MLSKGWKKVLGKTVSVFPGGDVQGRVELVAITKGKTKLGKLMKKLKAN